MFENFTDRARRVMALAQQEAHRFNHEYIGTEHILLALVKEGRGTAARVLKNLRVSSRKVRRVVEKLVKVGPETATMGVLPQTPRTKKVIEYAIEQARELGHSYVGSEHLLLGLLGEADGVAAQVLMSLGLTLDSAREEVRNVLRSNKEEPAADVIREEVDAPALVLLLDPGTATAAEIGQLLFEFSTLYRMLGGSGITFTTTDAREPAIV